MVLEVIAGARRRLLWNALAVESAHALSSAMGMAVLALLFGTALLRWYWLVLPPAFMLAAGAYLAWRRLPGLYPTAQLIDRRLGLADSLSTAWFFGSHPARPGFSPEIQSAQLERARHTAATVNVRAAIPIRLPRALYLSTALAVVAVSLVAVRFRVVGRLDLRPPIAAALLQAIERARDEIAKLEKAILPHPAERPEQARGKDRNSEAQGDADRLADAEAAAADGDAAAKSDPKKGDARSGDPEESESRTQAGGPSRSGAEQNSSSGRQSSDRPEGGQSGSQDSSSSMFSKLSDTMANLVSALKPQAGGRGRQQMDPDRNGKPRESGQAGKPGAGNQAPDADESGSSDGHQGAGSGQPGAQVAGTGQNAGANADPQPAGSGAGREEGSKDVKLAEQLAAMGKISVILGKRSENITGSAAVQVVSGEQRLTTQYETRDARHVDVQAKTDRDEVPLALQQYVQQYFREVRKPTVRPSRAQPLHAAPGPQR